MKFVRNHGKFKYLIDKWTWAFVVLASCERVFLLPNFFTIVHTIETFKWSTAAYAFMGNLTLELSHQSSWLVLQLYFKILISCYICSRNDVMTFITIIKGLIQWILFCFLFKLLFKQKIILYQAKMTGTCQSVKGSCNLFIEPQLTSFLVLYNLPHVLKIFTAYHSIWRYQLSGKFRIDR